jgi:hypothetical protein
LAIKRDDVGTVLAGGDGRARARRTETDHHNVGGFSEV